MTKNYETRQPAKADPDAILEYLESHRGHKYMAGDIAKIFKLNSVQARIGLQALEGIILKEQKHVRTFYYLDMLPGTEPSMAVRRTVNLDKVYVPDKQLGARCGELYPEHKGFVSFKGHIEGE